MRESKNQKAAAALCDSYSADCFRLCLLDVGNWEDAAAALQNALLRFRKTGKAEQNIVAARQALALETLRACHEFHERGKEDGAPARRSLETRVSGNRAARSTLEQLFLRPRWERVCLGLAAVLDLMSDEIAVLTEKPQKAVETLLAAFDLHELREALFLVQHDVPQKALVEALLIGAPITPEFRVRNMSLVLAAAMLITAAGLLLLYRLVVASQPVPDLYDDDAPSFVESEAFNQLYQELLNELSGYDYEMTAYHVGDGEAPKELLPMYEGEAPTYFEDGRALPGRAGYAMAALYGDAAQNGLSRHTTVCRYTKMVYDVLDDVPIYTNQEYLVWYDGQWDGVNLSQDRIYRIAATAAKFTQMDLQTLPDFPADWESTQEVTDGCTAYPLFVKHPLPNDGGWEITSAVLITGAAEDFPTDWQTQRFVPRTLHYLETGTLEQPSLDYQLPEAGLDAPDCLAMCYCKPDGTPADELLASLFAPDESQPSAAGYWETTQTRMRTRLVPELVGLTMPEAVQLLTETGLLAVAGEGAAQSETVRYCIPETGETVEFGSEVRLHVQELEE